MAIPESNYKCTECEKCFASRQRLKYHISNMVCNDKGNTNLCKFCGKGFSVPTSMYRHMRTTCEVKKHNDEKKNEIYERLLRLEEKSNNLEEKNGKLEKENEKLKQEMTLMKKEIGTKMVINNTTNNTNNGIINNITLVAYGSEDLKKLDKKEIIKALQNGYNSTIRLTEAVHFNPKHPEYHNVYITNMRDKYAMVYDGENWGLTTKNELINKLYDDKKNYIEDNMEDFVESLTVSQKNALERWLAVDDEDEKIRDIKDNIKLLLYNSKHIPIETTENIVESDNQKGIRKR